MNLLHVIPISRGIGKETLTYFSSLSVQPGAVVSVPLRKSIVPALVVDIEDALEAKTKVKSAGHTMKKVESVIAPAAFSAAFISAVRETAAYHGATAGAVLSRFTPLSFGEPFIEASADTLEIEHANTSVDMALLQSEMEERFSTYRGMIREAFAQNSSVFLVVPEISRVARLQEALGKGIEERVIVIHGNMTPTKRSDAWRAAITAPHPILIIGTGSYLSLPRKDIHTIIVEGERSHAYKEDVRPHLDIRMFARAYAKHLGARIVYGGLPLRFETLARIESGSAYAVGAIQTRVTSQAKVAIISMAKNTPDVSRKKRPYEAVLSEELGTLLSSAHASGNRSVVFVARKGLHGVTVCNDCGRMVRCTRCDAPLVLHKATDDHANTHLCHTCGARVPAKDRCANCNSWKLATIGIGSQYVEEALRDLLPDATIIRVDGDTCKTSAQLAKHIALFEKEPGAILVTTGIGLSALRPPIPLVAVASMDTVLSFPDFRAGERAIGILATLRTLAHSHLVVQTRNPEHAALSFAKDGNLADQYREDLIDRKDLGYPPFSVLIKLTVEGAATTVDRQLDELKKLFEAYAPHAYAGAGTKKSPRRAHILLKVPTKSWPNESLLTLLNTLSPSIDIDVNPESVL
ncbi:MAG: primosomal protein N' [Candidatus Yonathbacteria bacterium]|nr:primosomal protein N' [Candidatus Yonathbacteria bacterium]